MMDKDKLAEILERHRLWLQEQDGGTRANLRETDLQGADLQAADLRETNLQGADLQAADLNHANLSGANLQGADLFEADLQGANLRCASLRCASLRCASLLGADLCGANLCSANLGGANLRGANLRGAKLNYAVLHEADLREADLRGANLDYSIWPLWCGSLSVRIDAKIAAQLLYHALRAMEGVEDDEVRAVRNNPANIALANRFHRVGECGRLKEV